MKPFYNKQSTSSGIYKIINTLNQRIYIGKAKVFRQRFYEHRRKLMATKHTNLFLQHDFSKCGESVFEFHIIEVVEDSSQLSVREDYWLKQYHDGQKNCYNFMKTSSASDRTCFSKTPEETIKLISENSKAMWSDEEWKKKRVDACRTEEFRKKQSENQKRVAANPENGNSAAAAKARYSNEEYKKARTQKLKDAWARDDGSRRKKASEAAKIVYETNKETLRAALVEKTAKHYTLVSPEGDVVEVKNLAKFFREQGFKFNDCVYNLLRNSKSYHGWSIKTT